MVLWFKCDPPPPAEVRALEHMFTMVVVFEGVVGPLGVEISEEVAHENWALRLYGLTTLAVLTLLPGYGHNATKPSSGSYCHSFQIYCLCLPCPGGWQPSGAVSQNHSVHL